MLTCILQTTIQMYAMHPESDATPENQCAPAARKRQCKKNAAAAAKPIQPLSKAG